MAEIILVATLGAEAQVVTLALDQLRARGVPISRVIVVHTLADREPVRSSLERLYAEFVTDRHYGNQLLFNPLLLAGAAGPLHDVVTTAEIDQAFQSLYMLLRQHKHAGHTIHLCIAGGRKTMALFAMAAAQILFGPQDRVWHVLSNPELIASKRLHAGAADEVALIQVPVAYWARLRPDVAPKARDFVERVLTPAEREVTLLLIREGLSNAALAQRLSKSSKTISNQLSSVYEKLAQHFELRDTPDRTTLMMLLGSYS